MTKDLFIVTLTAMEEKENEISSQSYKKIILLSTFIIIFLLVLVIVSYQSAKSKSSIIILPGGSTYLGPSPSPAATERKIFTAEENVPWVLLSGKIYPVSLSVPGTLPYGIFPGDRFDSLTFFWNNLNPSENVFFRVEDLNKIEGQAKYIQNSKKEYAQNWWRQYSWTGVSTVDEFANSNGLKGYRTKYTNSEGKTPMTHIFLEVPGKPELVIWLANGAIDPAIFEKIVDSVKWNQKTP